jgi:hypothetical protein
VMGYGMPPLQRMLLIQGHSDWHYSRYRLADKALNSSIGATHNSIHQFIRIDTNIRSSCK